MKKFFLLIFLLSACSASKSADNGGGSKAAAGGTATASASDGKIQLAWTASSASPDGYYIEQSTDAVHYAQIKVVTTTSTLVTGATRGQVYYFRVRAYNAGGLSAFTSPVSVTP